MNVTSSHARPGVVPGIAATSVRATGHRRWITAVLVMALALLAYLAPWPGGQTQAPQFLTETVTRGSLVATVSATGTLQPTNQVEVGSELSGLVEAVLADDNDRVGKGQVLARLDVSKLHDQIARSKAALAAAEARVLQTAATTKEAGANLARLRTVSRLSGGKVPSQAEMETAEATLARAEADTASSRAAVAEVRATLSSDETNLSKASIRSPIDGVILTRTVEPGQTVAASFQAPVLFSLAEDLAQMELDVAVDEADVGQVREGQTATFGVDAYPGRRYPARIKRVGFGSQTTDGVVSYKTILSVDNSDLSLRPGMTATADITTARREDVVLVPNAALRFTPAAEEANDVETGGGIVSKLLPRPPHMARTRRPGARPDQPRVWVLRDGQPVPVDVTVGVSDGHVTEVTGGDLRAGMELVTEQAGATK